MNVVGASSKKGCVFCKIVKGKISSKYLYESPSIIVIEDINPSAETHLLIVPKNHIQSVLDIDKNHSKLLAEMYSVAQDFIKSENIKSAYKLVFNGGMYQFVPHLHMHLLGGEIKKEVV